MSYKDKFESFLDLCNTCVGLYDLFSYYENLIHNALINKVITLNLMNLQSLILFSSGNEE